MILHPALPSEVTFLKQEKPISELPTLKSPNMRRKRGLSLDSSVKLPKAEKLLENVVKKTVKLDVLQPNSSALKFAAAKHIFKKIDPRQDPPAIPEKFQIFSEITNPVDVVFFSKKVDPETIGNFLEKMDAVFQLDPSSIVLASFYLDQLLERCPDLPFNWKTWKRIVIVCVILACKAYEELGVFLEDFYHPQLFPMLSIQSLHQTEIALLDLLEYDIHWNQKDYIKTMLNFDLKGWN